MRWGVLPLVAFLLLVPAGLAAACTPDEYMSAEDHAMGPYDNTPPPWELNPSSTGAVEPVTPAPADPTPEEVAPRQPDATDRNRSQSREAAPQPGDRPQPVAPPPVPTGDVGAAPEPAPVSQPVTETQPSSVAPPAEPKNAPRRAISAEPSFRLPASVPSAGRERFASAPPRTAGGGSPAPKLALVVLLALMIPLTGLGILLVARSRRARPLTPADAVEAELQEIIAEARARELAEPVRQTAAERSAR